MSVIVFRKRLLAYTETFIASQGQYLPTMPTVFSGFKKDNTGFHLIDQKAQPNHSFSVELEDQYSKAPALTSGLHKRFGILNSRWVNALAKHNPTVLHAHFGPDGLAARPLAKALDVPLVTTFHGFDITIDHPVNRYRKNRHKVFTDSNRIIAVSDFVKNQLLSKGCPEDKITQHYIGVDTDFFCSSDTPKEEATLLFVGRLVAKKGCEYLIQAMAHIEKKCPGAKLRIAGDGPLASSLKTLASETSANIEFLGRLQSSDIKHEVQKATLLCAPSITSQSGDQEGLPISIMESIACATPVVSTYSAGIAEAIEDGKNGFLVREGEVTSLADRISTIIEDRQLHLKMSQEARNTALDKFDLKTQSAKLEALYLSLT